MFLDKYLKSKSNEIRLLKANLLLFYALE